MPNPPASARDEHANPPRRFLRRYFAHLLRVTCFAAVCFAALLYVDYRVARATVLDGLRGWGTRMVPYLDDKRTTEKPRTFRLNGIELHMAVGHTDHPPRFVRDWYLDKYAPRGPEMAAFRDSLRKHGLLDEHIPNATQVVSGDDHNGTVASIDLGGEVRVNELIERLSSLLSDGSIGKIGQFRYLLYNQEGSGTRFLTIWTDQTITVDQLMPAGNQDAEGFDLDGIPRYPGSKRILSAAEVGMPQASAIYDGPGSVDNVLAFYRGRLRTLGWAEDGGFAEQAQSVHGAHALRFTRNAGELLIDVTQSGGGVMASLVQMH